MVLRDKWYHKIPDNVAMLYTWVRHRTRDVATSTYRFRQTCPKRCGAYDFPGELVVYWRILFTSMPIDLELNNAETLGLNLYCERADWTYCRSRAESLAGSAATEWGRPGRAPVGKSSLVISLAVRCGLGSFIHPTSHLKAVNAKYRKDRHSHLRCQLLWNSL